MFDKTDFVQSENMSSNRERKASMSFYMLSKTYQVWTSLLNKIFSVLSVFKRCKYANCKMYHMLSKTYQVWTS